MAVTIFCDRDGTINKDENYYLGKDKNWKQQVSFLPGVVEGLRLLNSLDDTYVFIVTNQSGVAISTQEFLDLNVDRMHEVNGHIMERLSKKGISIHDYEACPFVDSKYKEKKKYHSFHDEFVEDNHPNMKPNPGMIHALLQKHFIEKPQQVFVVGDRISDMALAQNVQGTGLLIPSSKTKQRSVEQCEVLSEVHVLSDFFKAAQFIKHKITKTNLPS